MWPEFTNTRYFDLIAVPSHDCAKKARNIIQIKGAPHALNPQIEKKLRETWRSKLLDYPTPKIALIIGGSSRHKTFSLKMGLKLAELASKMAISVGGTLLITSSPRSGDIGRIIIGSISAPKISFEWGDEGENPYTGYLSVADAIIVTGDSISMCSEACFSTKPVYIFAPSALTTEKHKKFHNELYSSGLAKPFIEYMKSETISPLGWTHKPLNSSLEIAERLKKILFGGE